MFGKCDLRLRDQPYYGIQAACSEICAAIWQLRFSKSNNKSFHDFHQKLSQLFTNENVHVLAQIIPGLLDIANELIADGSPTHKTKDDDQQEEAKSVAELLLNGK